MKVTFSSLEGQIERLNKAIAHLCHLVNVAINLRCGSNYRKLIKKLEKLEGQIAPLEAMLEAEKNLAVPFVKSIVPENITAKEKVKALLFPHYCESLDWETIKKWQELSETDAAKLVSISGWGEYPEKKLANDFPCYDISSFALEEWIVENVLSVLNMNNEKEIGEISQAYLRCIDWDTFTNLAHEVSQSKKEINPDNFGILFPSSWEIFPCWIDVFVYWANTYVDSIEIHIPKKYLNEAQTSGYTILRKLDYLHSICPIRDWGNGLQELSDYVLLVLGIRLDLSIPIVKIWMDLYLYFGKPPTIVAALTEMSKRPELKAPQMTSKKKKTTPPPTDGHIQLSLF